MVEKMKTDVDRQDLVSKMKKSSILQIIWKFFFLLLKQKVVYLFPFSSSLPFPKF